MKPQSKIYEFYQENISEFNHVIEFADVVDIETTLKDNKTGWPKLKQLCKNDKELMISVLGFVLVLQLTSNEICELKKLNEKQKIKDRNIHRDTIQYMKKMYDKGCEHIRKIRWIDPSLDPHELKKKLDKWLLWKMHLRHRNLERWDDAIDWACLVDPNINQNELREKLHKKVHDIENDRGAFDKIMEFFYANIFSLYLILKDEPSPKTDNIIFSNMADLLNSLNVKTKTGKKFTRQNIFKIINQHS